MQFDCFNRKHLVTRISMYLEPNEIVSFSSCNKTLNENLSPITNPAINMILYSHLTKNFYSFEEDLEKDDICYNDETLLDNSWNSKINWKSFISKIFHHFKNYPDKEISKKVLENFRIHMFLLDLRKENIFLEFQNSSYHQIFCYDKYFRDFCTYNYYDKYINNNNLLSENGIKNKIKILKENLPFQNELINFKTIYNDFISDGESQKELNLILSYDFEKIDLLFEASIKNRNKNNNKITFFILWSNHCFIMYITYILETIVRFEDDNDETTFLNEFAKHHSNYINTALLMNSNFHNINIIVNYLNKFLTKKNQENKSNKKDINKLEKFSLYQLYIKIYEKNIYEKLFQKVNYKTSLLLKKYFGELLNTKINEEILDNNELMDYDDIIETDDNSNEEMKEEIEKMDESELKYSEDISKKDIINNISNCCLDMNINMNNSYGINHTNLIVGEKYYQYENMFIKEFTEFLEENIIEEKPLVKLFNIIEKTLKNDEIIPKFEYFSNSFNLINRTKIRILENSYKVFNSYLVLNLQKDFCSRIRYSNDATKKRFLFLNNLEYNKDYNFDLSNFSNSKRIKIEEKVKNEINNIKSILLEQNIKGYDTIETSNLINQYMDNNGIELVLLLKKMIYFYYKEIEIYKQRNKKIENCLRNKDNDNESSLNEIIGSKII